MTNPPDDRLLTETGFAPNGAGRVLIVACGALAREILDLRDLNGWSHLDLTCLPAKYHNTPDQITPAVQRIVADNAVRYQAIYVAYGDCGTGGQLAAACRDLGVEMIAGPHCYSFFEGNAQFTERAEMTAFYLTDFLVRQFDAFVWKPLGLDRHPHLRDLYFAHYDRLIYQAQTEDSELTARAKTCADRLGLAFERRMTGYGDLNTHMQAWAKA